ncbi:ATP-binding protein [Pseudomonas aeruginosa]|uniref:ATP-binding protein n=1 Tax=Pseudomonas aeruginosa TaxID=287 RepID=UPI0009A1EB64|nr:ATP-binding protein [Pseudomonas aeruginosa]OPF30761.1 hypothetical protein C533_21078 [Pseudomonas aeruginosa P47]OPF32299.1 hypothetical protein C532_20457 [Pseudomonas aeruginosa P37]OPF35467.1 hypothetical protein C531_19595 [Pseudomonas aeruginosa SD9]OPF46022.1 hypothetical protein C534_21603 [Pseudomonas aeruginosa P49]ORE47946.1 hypothetical protein B1H15_13985 [Pseudomonas aeruginosa]
MSTPFEAVADLKVGTVVEVSGSTVKVELSGDVSELTRSYGGRVYPIGQIGSIVKVHFGRRLVFGFVTLLRMKSEELAEMAVAPIPADADQRMMEIQLFAEGVWSTSQSRLSFSRGVSTYPLPLQNVYLLTREEAGLLYQSAEGQRPDGMNPLVPFATYAGADAAQCRANIDKMFSLHTAVLGSTGSGKSGAVAALLHSILEHVPRPDTSFTPRIIMIDPHGEYGRAFNDRAVVYRAYDPIGNDETEGRPIKLPYWLMSAEEFRLLVIGKTEFEATSQHNIVYKALTHARMVAAGIVDPAPNQYGWPIPSDGRAHDEPRPRQGVHEETIIEFDRDKPRPFSLTEFVNHIEFVQAARPHQGAMQRVTDTDYAKGFKSILDKLSVLRRDPRIRFLMNEWQQADTLSALIGQFVGSLPDEADACRDLRIIDISGLPNEVAGPLAAVIARLLFQYKLYQTLAERQRDPILLVCEEAHRYVPDKGEAEYAAAQTAVRRIAREGRKYGIGLMLVSQRPADIESTVISQCGTWLVLRLTNSTDQTHVARFLPDGLSGMTKALSTLAQQEALFVGEGAALPAKVRVRSLPENKLPRSESVSFANGWSTARLEQGEIDMIASRMAGQLEVP